MEVQRASPVAMAPPAPLAHLPPAPVPLFIASPRARQNNLAAPAPAPFALPPSPQRLPFAAPPSPQQLPFAALPSPQQLPFAAPPSPQQGAPAPPTKAPVPFAKALHKMLGDAPQLIRLEEGCVAIPSPSALEGILGKYYRTSKYTSFQRQLTGFGFHRQATAGRAGSLVTIYRRSPEAGGRIDSVDAILGIRRVVRLTRRRRLTHAPEDSDVEEEVPVDSDDEVIWDSARARPPAEIEAEALRMDATAAAEAHQQYLIGIAIAFDDESDSD